MTPNHHPLPETLISFASGTLPNAISAVVACHLTMCRACAEAVRDLEVLGGFLLDRLDAGPDEKTIAERALACWSANRAPEGSGASSGYSIGLSDSCGHCWRATLPPSGEISWQRVSAGVRHHRIALPDGSGEMRLLRLTPGEFLPERVSAGAISRSRWYCRGCSAAGAAIMCAAM